MQPGTDRPPRHVTVVNRARAHLDHPEQGTECDPTLGHSWPYDCPATKWLDSSDPATFTIRRRRLGSKKGHTPSTSHRIILSALRAPTGCKEQARYQPKHRATVPP